MTVKYRAKKIRELLEAREGPAKLARWLKRGDKDDGRDRPKLSDFSLKDLAESLLGPEAMAAMASRVNGNEGYFAPLVEAGGMSLMESGGTPVGLTAFKNITGQLVFSEIRDGFQQEAFAFSQRVKTVQSRIAGQETVPGMQGVGDKAESVAEGQVYPTAGFGEEYFLVPGGVKKGLVIEVTEEAIFFDLTGKVAENANKNGQNLGLLKEKRLIDVFIGQVNNYNRNGTATNTYLTTGAYTNASVIELIDWTSIDAVEQAFNDILDPNTSEPIELMQPDLICVPALDKTARRIQAATETITRTNPAAGTAAERETRSPSPLKPFNILSTRLLYRRILAGPQTNAAKAKTWWFYGELAELMAWKENWGLQTFAQGPDGPHAFERDVSLRVKARYRGEAYAREPRRMYRAGDNS